MTYLVDTCVLIDHLTGRLPSAVQGMLERLVAAGEVCTSAVVYHELMTGAQTTRAREAVEHLLAAWEVLPVDVVVARDAAGIRRRRRAQGRTIAMADALIAATARVHHLTVMTGNVKDFPDVATEDLSGM
jgi:predicted nucleic acid-binding protein